MRRTLPWLLAIGCTGGVEGVPTGKFAVGIAAVRPELEVRDPELGVSVRQLLFDGEGPEGPESVAIVVDERFEPLDSTDPIGFELDVGRHAELDLRLTLSADDGPAVEFRGTPDETEWRIEIDSLDLEFRLPELVVTDQLRLGSVVFHPGQWLETFEDVGDDLPLVVVTEGSPLYDDVVDEILDTTEFTLDPVPAIETDDDDDEDHR